ncbi:c-type cytochrome [Kordia antarctica]|nr:cytochrome c [Kordia antarctica]
MAASTKRGKVIYDNVCVQCHMANGEGVANVFPPLAKSNWLKDKVTESIRSIKYGLQGEITVNGEKYNSVMSPLGLSDQEVADVMNYTSNVWGNISDQMFTAEQVSKVKKK